MGAMEVLEEASSVAPAGEYLSFGLGREEYAIDILKVHEIRHYEAPTSLAGSPPHVKGVINLRGTIVPIVDLRWKLGLAEAGYDAHTVVILLNVLGRTLGVVVDRVSEVIALKPDQIKPAPGWERTAPGRYLLGLAAVERADARHLLILVDMDRLVEGDMEGLAAREVQHAGAGVPARIAEESLS